MSFKAKFKDLSALETELDASWGTFTEDVTAALAHLEAERALLVKRRNFGIGITVIAVVPIFLFDAISELTLLPATPLWVPSLIIYFCVVLPLSLYIAAKLFRDPNAVFARYEKILQTLVFAKVFTLFGLVGERVVNPIAPETTTDASSAASFWQRLSARYKRMKYIAPMDRLALDFLDQSELITEPRNSTVVGDTFRISYGVNELTVAELDVKHIRHSRKNRQIKNIFKGYLVAFDLPARLEAKTFVTTEGDTIGFANQTFLNNVLSNDVRVTELEWNAFENLLHVATTNEVEARYILTTNFMQDLYDWWVEKKQSIRISFIASRMYILFPDSNIRVLGGTRSLETSELRAYILSIAEPLMHVLHLVEDVNIRS